MADVCVDLATLESLLEVFVDGLVGDFAEQGEVGYANLLLLGDFVCGLLGLGRLPRCALLGIPGGLILGTPRDTLL